jgi:SCP-2 sterol transfer family protein
VIVPERPEEFFSQFVPLYFAELASRAGVPKPRLESSGSPLVGVPARAPAPAGVAIRVVDAGVWTLRIVNGQLRAETGSSPDVALQVSLHERDFGKLIVTPLRRALQALADKPSSENARALLQTGFWARLGRWDEETVDLLRRQSGGILVRIEDAGTSRNVALTPGTRPYSLAEAECTIDCRLEDLEQLQAKQSSPLDLFYAGQIRIGGDAQIALAMAGLFL